MQARKTNRKLICHSLQDLETSTQLPNSMLVQEQTFNLCKHSELHLSFGWNILIMVMSLVDFYAKVFTHSTFFRKDYLNFDGKTKINLIIEWRIHLGFSFVWLATCRTWKLFGDSLKLTYEDNDWWSDPNAIADVFRLFMVCSIQTNRSTKIAKIGSKCKEAKSRFLPGSNSGPTLGRIGLSNIQKDKIQEIFTKYFPID